MRIYPGTRLFERAVGEGQISRDTDLLPPTYYLAPGLTAEAVFAQLQEFARVSPNWIVGDPAPGYTSLVERLRQRGVVGPLWSYFRHAATHPTPDHSCRPMTKRLLLISPVASDRPDGQGLQLPPARARPAESGGPHAARLAGDDPGREGRAAGPGPGRRPGRHHRDDHHRAARLRDRRPFPPPRHQGRHGRHARLGPAGRGAAALRQRGGRRSRGALAPPAADFERQSLQPIYRHEDGFPRSTTCRGRTGTCIATSVTCRCTSSKPRAAARWTASSARSPPPSAAGIATARPRRCSPNCAACGRSTAGSPSRTACSSWMTTSSATAPTPGNCCRAWPSSSSNGSATPR